ncbi:hypothetical protein HN51_036495, partial [Arachis hypogaea]
KQNCKTEQGVAKYKNKLTRRRGRQDACDGDAREYDPLWRNGGGRHVFSWLLLHFQISVLLSHQLPPPPPTISPNPLLSLSSTTKPSLNPPPPPQHVPLAPTTTTLQSPSHNSTNTCLSSPLQMTTKNHVKSVALLESTMNPKPPASATSHPILSSIAVKKVPARPALRPFLRVRPPSPAPKKKKNELVKPSSSMDPQAEPVSYICRDCGMENTLKPGDVIQCRECGYRILYKKRTRRIVQYEAH